jgi:hypothetical protein
MIDKNKVVTGLKKIIEDYENMIESDQTIIAVDPSEYRGSFEHDKAVLLAAIILIRTLGKEEDK